MDFIFPFKTELSLHNIIGFWELKKHDGNAYQAETARRIVDDVNKYPELRGNITDLAILEKHKDLIEALLSAVFPSATQDEQIMGVFRPFSMEYFYGSTRFYELIERGGGISNMINDSMKEDMACSKIMAAYQTILHQFYNVDLPQTQSFPLRIKEPNGLMKYYHLQLNPRFCEIKLHGDLPDLSAEELQEVVDRLDHLDFVKSKLPPDLFEFSGFGIYTVSDATTDQVVSAIKEILLEKDSIILDSSFEDIEDKFKCLLNQPNLQIGLTALKSGKSIFRQIGDKSCRSLLIDDTGHYIEPFYNINQRLMQSREPYIVKDIRQDQYFKSYEEILPDNLRSIIFCPLYIDDRLVGILEVASPEAGSINPVTYVQIAEILPLFAVAINRSAEELENKLRSIIKENYTSIHPTVEWKFSEAALKMLEQEQKGLPIHPEEVIFKNVFPLFAVSDIRNSSMERNNAIVADLLTQLKVARDVLVKGKELIDFPLLNELVFKINKTITRLKKGLISGDETSVIHFFNEEIEPVIKNLDKDIEGFGEISSSYWGCLDRELKIVYEKRKAFEASLTAINEAISRYLEQEQEKAQRVFPHYFEKYKTDGVEYNAYIGASITNTKKFKSHHLKNLRLWQLITTAEIARQTAALKNSLPVPLDTTHLILVHNQPLSVRFRMDEKQFDVDGAYNMRYEIVKKRIDKVHIKDTDERLTQPNKIAVVFSHDESANEYLGYFEYLRQEGYIHDQIEELELEELQGVNGLKALRASIEPANQTFMAELENLKEASLSH